MKKTKDSQVKDNVAATPLTKGKAKSTLAIAWMFCHTSYHQIILTWKLTMFRFLTILFIQILCGMELDLFIPSFPELQRVFTLTPALVQLTISVNFVAFCLCCLFAGALGDRYNRRHVLLLGLFLFVLGSIQCVIATSFPLLLLGRVLQGIGISAPSILSFPIILEDYTAAQQPGVMGMINGVKTLAMAIAPVIGSFVNLYFSWRGNFTILLALGLLCLLASFIAIPSKCGNKSVSLSLKAYLPLLQSEKYLTFTIGLSLLTAAYWLFMGMAPILYMEALGITLKHFGYYQGALSLTFALICIISPTLLNRFGQQQCLRFGLTTCLISALLVLTLAVMHVQQAIIITIVLIIFTIGIVFPINILFPAQLELVPLAKGRSAGLGLAILLLMTALLLELVSYNYHGQFMPIGIAMFITIGISLLLIRRIIKKKWLVLP
jgi:DHA1 family bicyclomycin/chloramphenicol resistance-like MFS transporter